jgi:nucleoside-diphosphate-sugar epimerase
MKIVVIGGSGHIGTFLVPRLVRAGHEVVSITRSGGTGYHDALEWEQVAHVKADREQEDAGGTFGRTVLAQEPDVVIDLVCYTLESATAIVEALRGKVAHYVFCGSIWRAGESEVLPISEEKATAPFSDYGVGKHEVARMLKEETRSGGLATTTLHPGHISGPGWVPIGPTGNVDPGVWKPLSSGEPLKIPGLGAETMAHVHADDVAQAFELAVDHRDAAAGEDFFITAADALNVRGYARLGASWFGKEAILESTSWNEFRAGLDEEHAEKSWEHLVRSHYFTVEKARRLLGYEPQHSAGETVLESVRWLVEHGEIEVASPLVV